MEVNKLTGWDEEKSAFIRKLERQEECFSELFAKDKDGIIIGHTERDTLSRLRERNTAVLARLKSREFAVAVVGLEKAGKSTLGNALINSEILPEYTERCTYTTTELRAGDCPDINSPQLDMLRKVRDQDGVKLRDKTFVFGNKIDMAGNEQRAKGNDSALGMQCRLPECEGCCVEQGKFSRLRVSTASFTATRLCITSCMTFTKTAWLIDEDMSLSEFIGSLGRADDISEIYQGSPYYVPTAIPLALAIGI